MSERNETVADIVADIRERAENVKRHGNERPTSGEAIGNLLLSIAYRIESAVKREREPATICSGLGNTAKLREVLENVRDWLVRANNGPLDALATSQFIITARSVNDPAKGVIRDNEYHIGQIDAALAAPTRNCDRFANHAHCIDYWRMHAVPQERADGWRIDGKTFPDIVPWFFAPAAKEGGDHADA